MVSRGHVLVDRWLECETIQAAGLWGRRTGVRGDHDRFISVTNWWEPVTFNISEKSYRTKHSSPSTPLPALFAVTIQTLYGLLDC